jgi:hypothetical protein
MRIAVVNYFFVGNSVFGTSSIGSSLKATVTYTEVPGPLPFLGAATAFSFGRKLRKRCKARVVASINTPAATFTL